MSKRDCVTLLHSGSPGKVKFNNNGSLVNKSVPNSVGDSMYVGKSLFLVVIWWGDGG